LRKVPGYPTPPGFFCHHCAAEMPSFVYWVDILKPKANEEFHQAVYDAMI